MSFIKKCLDSVIKFLTGTAKDLEQLESKAQEVAQEYSNKQCRKTAIVCGSIGLIIGIVIGLLF